MKTLNTIGVFTLVVIFFLSFVACQADLIDQADPETSFEDLTALEEGGCAFPGLGEFTCPNVTETQALASYTLCEISQYGLTIADFFEDEDYAVPEGDLDALFALTGIIFHYATNEYIAIPESSAALATSLAFDPFWKCVGEVLDIEELLDVLKKYRAGKLTKKQLLKVVGKFLVKKLGPIGAAITLCEFVLCLGK